MLKYWIGGIKMDKKSFLYILIAGICWGTSGIFVKSLAVFGLSTNEVVTVRFLGAAIAVFALVCIRSRGKKLRATLPELLLFVLSGALMYAAGAFYYAAIQEASPAVAVSLMYTAPALVIVVSALFLKEKMTWTKALCVVLSVLGCMLITGVFGKVQYTKTGLFYAIMAGVTYGGYTIVAKIEMLRGISGLTASTYNFIVAAAFSFFGINASEAVIKIADGGAVAIVLCVLTGLVTAAIPYFFYTLSMKKLPAGVAAALGTLEPLVATVIGVVLYNDVLGVSAWIGVAMILSSVALLFFAEK